MAEPERRGLQLVLATLGAVATVAGARGVLRGATEVSRGGPVAATVDSEYRFYASWYHVFGLLLLRAARSPERDGTIVRAAAGGSLLAACGRLLSQRAQGRPSRGQQILMAIELAIPAVVLPWHRRFLAARLRERPAGA